jgi:hypothetical protein
MNRAQQKGTNAETGVVQALRPFYPMAERRGRQGNRDRGDIGGVAPGVVIEVKAQVASYRIGPWLLEADVEALNDDASLAVVWFKLKGKGDPLDWPVMMRGRYFLPLLRSWTGADGYPRQLGLFEP